MTDGGQNKASAPDVSAMVDDERADPAPIALDDGSIDHALETTFPASDPPSWMATGGRAAKAE